MKCPAPPEMKVERNACPAARLNYKSGARRARGGGACWQGGGPRGGRGATSRRYRSSSSDRSGSDTRIYRGRCSARRHMHLGLRAGRRADALLPFRAAKLNPKRQQRAARSRRHGGCPAPRTKPRAHEPWMIPCALEACPAMDSWCWGGKPCRPPSASPLLVCATSGSRRPPLQRLARGSQAVHLFLHRARKPSTAGARPSPSRGRSCCQGRSQ